MALPAGCHCPWAKSVDAVQAELQVSVASGLTSAQVAERRQIHGLNELSKEPPTPLWKLILEQFDDTLVKILLGSAAVSFGLAFYDGEVEHEGLRAFVEPLVILLILVLNAAVGVWQESRSEAALDALKELQSESARVLRDGKLISDLPSKELVPGDVVELHVGDRVPADMRIVTLRTATVRAEQSSLTGESVAVMKTSVPMRLEDCELQAKENMVFSGTAIANGTAVCIVTSTGMSTEIGKIQSQITAAGEETSETPLKKKLDEFGELLAKVIAFICLLVWVINYRHFMTFDILPGLPVPIPNPSTIKLDVGKMVYYLKIAVALAVAAIPEGLPAVITTCLALGTRTMAKKNAIVRKLPSVETLGCTTVICSDKTGTLTTNQMSAVQLVAAADSSQLRTWEVTGHTYNPAEGQVLNLLMMDKAPVLVRLARQYRHGSECPVTGIERPGVEDDSVKQCRDKAVQLQQYDHAQTFCNEASIEFKNGAFRCVGAPTEAALKVLTEKLGTTDVSARAEIEARRRDPSNYPEPVSSHHSSKYTVRSLLEFDRDRKSMSVLATSRSGDNVLFIKGAAECLLDRSTKVMLPDGSVVAMSPALRKAVLASVEQMAGNALRCLALAVKTELGPLAKYDGNSGHAGHRLLADPSQYAAIESDLVFVGLVGLQDPPRPEVAGAIQECRQAGIRVMVITGDNKKTAESICRAIGPEEQKHILATSKACVFSRAEPKHKQDIVRLLKELGEITAMTGDGVNDAPALKLADIGIAMGISGTEVAKEASDMVLADDNFSSIVAAVAEGRSIYNNMKAFIRYMISSNIGEVASIFLTAALGLPEGLIPVQLLWVNLVTDGPPATALGFNKADKDIMTKPPRNNYTAGDQTISFNHPCEYFTVGKTKAMTLSLSVIVAIEMFNALNALSEDASLLVMPPWTNPYLLLAITISISLHCVILYVPFLASIFSIVPLSWAEWQLVILWSFPVIVIDELLKLLARLFFGVRKLGRCHPPVLFYDMTAAIREGRCVMTRACNDIVP
ncbi:cation_ATPase_N domain-containing protein [Haematococcus lacustris]|uniref:P-type Ca(2+) transporter n=1 Tax=Haematococcus lacustris TaxID=44745 RepID=A0A699YEU2_HAELA|nr:cation_ATPase_N domain-containing protein [Haematococcus lacustris]